MKLQLIMLQQPILVSDEEIQPCKPANICAAHFTKPCDKCGRFQGKRTYIANLSALSEKDCKEIGWVDVERLTNDHIDNSYKNSDNAQYFNSKACEIDFVAGFKTAQSLNENKFSLQDVQKAIEMARLIKDNSAHDEFTVEDVSGCTEVCTYDWKPKFTDKQIIESLSHPKVFDVEVEMEEKGGDNLTNAFNGKQIYFQRPKITNNSIRVIKIISLKLK